MEQLPFPLVFSIIADRGHPHKSFSPKRKAGRNGSRGDPDEEASENGRKGGAMHRPYGMDQKFATSEDFN